MQVELWLSWSGRSQGLILSKVQLHSHHIDYLTDVCGGWYICAKVYSKGALHSNPSSFEEVSTIISNQSLKSSPLAWRTHIRLLPPLLLDCSCNHTKCSSCPLYNNEGTISKMNRAFQKRKKSIEWSCEHHCNLRCGYSLGTLLLFIVSINDVHSFWSQPKGSKGDGGAGGK